jgi:hypothetical protein
MSAPGSNDEENAVRSRWTDAPGAGTVEGRAGALLRKAATPRPLDDGQLAAVRARLLLRERPGARRAWTLRFATVVMVVLGFSTLVVAATQVKRWIETRRQVEREQERGEAGGAHPRARAHRRAPRSGEVVAEDVVAPVAAPAPETPPPAPPEPVPVLPAPVEPRKAAPRMPRASAVTRTSPAETSDTGPTRGAETSVGPTPAATEPPPQRPPASRTLALNSPGTAAPAAPAASPLADESALLARALLMLRQRNDARGALTLFDEHAARFPGGPLALEARVGRVEALLQLGRREDALAILDLMTLPSTGKRRDMLVTRGELRARAGRCAEALIDFGLTLTREAQDDVAAERALYGRASCRARLGDADGARADLEAYVARFPSGRFAADVRASLNR